MDQATKRQAAACLTGHTTGLLGGIGRSPSHQEYGSFQVRRAGTDSAADKERQCRLVSTAICIGKEGDSRFEGLVCIIDSLLLSLGVGVVKATSMQHATCPPYLPYSRPSALFMSRFLTSNSCTTTHPARDHPMTLLLGHHPSQAVARDALIRLDGRSLPATPMPFTPPSLLTG